MSIHKEAVRIATAAEMLEYDASTIRRKLKRGDLEAIGAGRGLRTLTHDMSHVPLDTPYPRVYTPNVPCMPHMPIGGDATMTDQGLLRTRDVAEMLTVSERQIRDMAQQGEIPAIRIGGEWRFERAAIVQWLERQRTGPKESAT